MSSIATKNITCMSGFSLLEQAIVLPAICLLIAGAFDANNLLAARSALRRGAGAALRCMYPTDGECRRANYHNKEPKYFIEYQQASSNRNWQVEWHRYQADSTWLEYPRFEEIPFANILTSVEYDLLVPSYRQTTEHFAASAQIRYLVQTYHEPVLLMSNTGDIPVLVRPDHNLYGPGQTPAPTALWLDRTANPAAFNDTLVTGGNIVANASGATKSTIGTFTLDIPFSNRLQTVSCYQTRSSSSNHTPQPDFNRSCNHHDIPIVLVVLGIGQATKSNPGHVTIEYSQDESHWSSLGGQTFIDSNGNFFPRGVSQKHVKPTHPELEPLRSPEFDTYRSLHIDRAKPLFLRFVLSSPTGKLVAWEPTQFRVYTPQYQLQELTADCSGAPTTTTSNCRAIYQEVKGTYFPEATIVGLTYDHNKVILAEDGPHLCPNANNESFATGCRNNPDGRSRICYAPTDDQTSCQPLRQPTLQCVGVVEAPTSGQKCNLLARQHCNLPSQALNVRCHSTRKQLGVPQQVEVKTCDSPKSYQWPRRFTKLGSFSVTRQELKPGHICLDGSLNQHYRRHPEDYCPNLLKPRTFKVNADTDIVNSETCNWQEAIFADWQYRQLSPTQLILAANDLRPCFAPTIPNCPFRAGHTIDRRSSYLLPPQDIPPRYVDEIVTVKNSSWQQLPNGPLEVHEFPAQCSNGTWNCRTRLAPNLGASQPSSKLDLLKAEQLAVAPVRGIMPKVKLNCDQPGCLRVSLPNKEPGSKYPQERLEIQLTLKVPLITLAGAGYPLRFQASEHWEGFFVQ